MSKFVRQSKFRHVFGTPAKKDGYYDALKVSRSAWDSNKVKCSAKFVGVQWEASGGGAIAAIPIERQGKQPTGMGLVAGHKGPVLDMDWSPFNDNLVATASEDTTVAVWNIPDGGLKENLTDPAQRFTAHRKKVGSTDWHPCAANVLATTATDPGVKIWDVEAGKELFSNSEAHGDIIQGWSWNTNGSLSATSCKDKKLRIFDPRQGSVAQEKVDAHQGVKGFRAVFISKPKDYIFTVGFNKTSERQYALWDPLNLANPLKTGSIDNASGLIMPFWDNDLGIMYLAGKGDGNIRYYEVTDEGDFIYYLSEYKSKDAQNGMGWVPKRGLDLTSCEVARFMKATGTYVEPIPFCVPRKGDTFQDDLYPPTLSHEPSMTASEWAGGANTAPNTIQLEPGKTVSASSTFTATGSGDEVSALKARVAELEAQLEEKNKRIAELENK